MQGKTQAQVQNLIKFSFHHLFKLPEENIREAVILVSIHDGIEHAFKAIANPNLHSEQFKIPNLYQLDKNTPIIYPTQAFLNSQLNHNFVSMHYLLNTVERAKFIFVFKHADLIQKPIKNIKQTMIRFVSLFAQTVSELGRQLSTSCGYIIYQAQRKAQKYINMLSGMYSQSQNYVKEVQVKNLCKYSMQLSNIVLFQKGEKKAKQLFSELVGKLKYFKLPQKVKPSNRSSQSDYRPNQIYERWSKYFKRIYQKLDVLIDQSKQIEKPSHFYPIKLNNVKRYEQDLCQQPERIIHKDYQKERPLKIKFSQKTYRLCSFVSNYLTLIGLTSNRTLEQYFQHQYIVQQFMNSLFDYGYLTRYSIYIYVISFFKFYKFFPKNQESTHMLIQKIDFKEIIGNTKIIDQKMTFLINKLYTFLEEDIVSADIGYPFVEIIKQLTEIYQILNNKKYGFATQRTFKKLIKYRAQLAFRRATVVTNAYNIPKAAIREAWLLFIGYALQSNLIQSSKIQVALTFFAQELVKQKQFQLALKVYSRIPEYKSYKKMIAIYERDYKFNPQILKYKLNYDWPNKRGPFQDYCKLLLRIGFCQKVRELCLEGLKVFEEDDEGSQLLKGILINARGDQSRDTHFQFLQNLNQEQKQIKIDLQLFRALQKQFKENKIK